MSKLITIIEQIPWYMFLLVIAFFTGNIFNHPGELSIFIFSTIGIACMTYLAVHNFDKRSK